MTALSINRALTMLNEHRQMLLNSMRNLKSTRITFSLASKRSSLVGLREVLGKLAISKLNPYAQNIDLGLTLGSLVRKTEMLFQQACWYSCRAGSDTLASETGDLVIDQMLLFGRWRRAACDLSRRVTTPLLSFLCCRSNVEISKDQSKDKPTVYHTFLLASQYNQHTVDFYKLMGKIACLPLTFKSANQVDSLQ
ncbi:hypothetical protein T12_5728 [Trichinella patagoniensis]|uniref:Uncharacterized protein n=1 Tax=Trichinella patagoniensis TaxID=990121 RepID=A0A0V1A750_9BILA|nr:hypothetical protein T12_5728 [Trichinella patagoniensis]